MCEHSIFLNLKKNLGAIVQSRKAPIIFVMSVRPSVYLSVQIFVRPSVSIDQHRSTWMDFRKKKICPENQILLKSGENSGHFSIRPILLLLATFSHNKTLSQNEMQSDCQNNRGNITLNERATILRYKYIACLVLGLDHIQLYTYLTLIFFTVCLNVLCKYICRAIFKLTCNNESQIRQELCTDRVKKCNLHRKRMQSRRLRM